MILDSLILQTKLFLQEDMDIDIEEVLVKEESDEQLTLNQHTSMIGVGGKLNLMIVISFDNGILGKLVELFMDGEEPDEEEADEIKESVTGEVINTILGLALPTFPYFRPGLSCYTSCRSWFRCAHAQHLPIYGRSLVFQV